MIFSNILPRFSWDNTMAKNTKIEEINKISHLKEQLVAVGYNTGEVNYMIRIFSDNIKFHKLDKKQLMKLEERLEEQLASARQCIEFIKGPQ